MRSRFHTGFLAVSRILQFSRLRCGNTDSDVSDSADGLCAINLNHALRAVSDTAKSAEISTAAKQLLDKCVLRDASTWQYSIGGVIRGIGE